MSVSYEYMKKASRRDLNYKLRRDFINDKRKEEYIKQHYEFLNRIGIIELSFRNIEERGFDNGCS